MVEATTNTPSDVRGRDQVWEGGKWCGATAVHPILLLFNILIKRTPSRRIPGGVRAFSHSCGEQQRAAMCSWPPLYTPTPDVSLYPSIPSHRTFSRFLPAAPHRQRVIPSAAGGRQDPKSRGVREAVVLALRNRGGGEPVSSPLLRGAPCQVAPFERRCRRGCCGQRVLATPIE